MNHIMLDIETMGTDSSAAVTAVAAAYFNLTTGEIGDTFSRQISLEDEINAGAKLSAGNIQFWIAQGADVANTAMFSDPEPAKDVLSSFFKFVRAGALEGSGLRVWGNGSVFDNVILENAFKRYGLLCPWPFWASRDVRTVVDLALVAGLDARGETPFEGTPHVALDDVKHQVRYLSAASRFLLSRNQTDK